MFMMQQPAKSQMQLAGGSSQNCMILKETLPQPKIILPFDAPPVEWVSPR